MAGAHRRLAAQPRPRRDSDIRTGRSPPGVLPGPCVPSMPHPLLLAGARAAGEGRMAHPAAGGRRRCHADHQDGSRFFAASRRPFARRRTVLRGSVQGRHAGSGPGGRGLRGAAPRLRGGLRFFVSFRSVRRAGEIRTFHLRRAPSKAAVREPRRGSRTRDLVLYRTGRSLNGATPQPSSPRRRDSVRRGARP